MVLDWHHCLLLIPVCKTSRSLPGDIGSVIKYRCIGCMQAKNVRISGPDSLLVSVDKRHAIKGDSYGKSHVTGPMRVYTPSTLAKPS